MFGTLLGALPRPTDPDGTPVADHALAVLMALDAQHAAGLEPLTDGRLGWRSATDAGGAAAAAAAWRFASERAPGIVKQALPGPYTLGRRLATEDRDRGSRRIVDELRRAIEELAEAGCPIVEIEERDAHLIGEDEGERERFASAHRRLLEGIEGIHCSLSIVGENADSAGIGTILAAPYASLAVDLIAGPDNWHLVRDAPGEVGIICGAQSPTAPTSEGPELLVWAAAYAASSRGRGPLRVGLATAGGLEGRTWADAVELMRRLGKAAGLAGRPIEEIASELDPRAFDARSAALGRREPPRR